MSDTAIMRCDDLRRVLLDATRGPCDCPLCVEARRRVRAAAWPRVDSGWPDIEERHHAPVGDAS